MNNKRNLNIDVYAGFILAALGIYFYSLTQKMGVQTATFPRIVLAAFIFLALAMSLEAFWKNKKKSKQALRFQLAELKLPLLMFFFICLYTVALEFIGFYFATALFIPCIAFFYQNKKIVSVLAVTFGLIAFLHLLLVVQLKILLP